MFEKYKDENSIEYLELCKHIERQGTIYGFIDLLLTRYNIIKAKEQDKYKLLLSTIDKKLSRVALINDETYNKIDNIFDSMSEDDRSFYYVYHNKEIISILRKNYKKMRNEE